MFSHLDPYKEIWNQKRAVTINNLISDLHAEEIWEAYKNSPDFKVAFWTNEVDEDGGIPIQYAEKGTKRYNDLTKITYQMVAENTFSYRFSRTSWIHPYLEALWSSKLFVGSLEYITGFENLNWIRTSTFTSKYEAGDFLYTHTDKGNGRVAFVYQLTKDWLPGYGGLFMKMKDWIHVDSTIIPEFNKLTIFDVAQEGVPHIVTQVVPEINNSRIAYSGWLA